MPFPHNARLETEETGRVRRSRPLRRAGAPHPSSPADRIQREVVLKLRKLRKAEVTKSALSPTRMALLRQIISEDRELLLRLAQ